MKLWNLSAVVGLVSLMAACSSFTAPQRISELDAAQPSGNAFTQALVTEYRELAHFEADEMYDWRDAEYFALKGLRAADGEVVEPQAISERNLPAANVNELTQGRSDMMELFDAGARDRFPELAARTQGRFDCWMEQQEENIQPDHIAACREEFYAALNELQAAMAPPPPPPAAAPEPAPMAAPETYIVYFGFDSATVASSEMQAIERAFADAQGAAGARVSVTGHADRAGPEEYNLGLSLRRAEAVREQLTGRGIPASAVTIAGRGEAENAVPTADGVREPANRRVEIVVLR